MIDYEKLAEMDIYSFQVNLTWFYNKRKMYDTLKAKTEEEALFLGRELAIVGEEMCIDYNISVWNIFEKKWIYEWDYNKVRVAPYNHKVFVIASSRDCDGMAGYDVVSFESFKEAAEWEEDFYSNLEGPGGYSCVDREFWETWERPESRDIYAERMGY